MSYSPYVSIERRQLRARLLKAMDPAERHRWAIGKDRITRDDGLWIEYVVNASGQLAFHSLCIGCMPHDAEQHTLTLNGMDGTWDAYEAFEAIRRFRHIRPPVFDILDMP